MVQLLFVNKVALNPGLGGVGMSDLPLSLMSRLNQTESAVFNCCSKGSLFRLFG